MIRWLLGWWRSRQVGRAEIRHIQALLLADHDLHVRAEEMRHYARVAAIQRSATAVEAKQAIDEIEAVYEARQRYRRSLWHVPVGALSLTHPSGSLSEAP